MERVSEIKNMENGVSKMGGKECVECMEHSESVASAQPSTNMVDTSGVSKASGKLSDVYLMDSNIRLMDFQVETIERAWRAIKNRRNVGIRLFTSAGKTYIGAELASRFVEYTSGESNVIWISTKKVNENIQSKLKKEIKVSNKVMSRIIFANLELMARDNFKVDEAFNNVGLIILDEAHRALSTKAGANVQKIIGKFRRCPRVAMTATPLRTDKRNAFRELLGSNYLKIDKDLGWASANNVVNEVTYVACPISVGAYDKQLLYHYAEIGKYNPRVKELCDKVSEAIDKYQFNVEEGVLEILSKSGMQFNCADGDKHIIFFSEVDKLRRYKPYILSAFKKLYGDTCNVRAWEYHSKTHGDSNNSVLENIINGGIQPHVVDLIFTVNMGNESIHPKGIRSILMFRKTYSPIIYTQQVGRVISMRNIQQQNSFVFDFADNYLSFSAPSTIGTGRYVIEERPSSSEAKVITLEEICKVLGGGNRSFKIQAKFGTEKLANIHRLYNLLDFETEGSVRLKNIVKLISLINNNLSDAHIKKALTIQALDHDTVSLGTLVDVDKTIPNNKITREGVLTDEFKLWYKAFRQNLIGGNYNNVPGALELVRKTGHLFYSTRNDSRTNQVANETALRMIDAVYNNLKAKKFDYDELTKTNMSILMDLRNAEAEDKLPIEVLRYADLFDVDIRFNSEKSNLVKGMVSNAAKRELWEYYNELEKELNVLKEKHSNGTLTDADRERIKEIKGICTVKFVTRNNFGDLLIKQLRNNFGDLFKLTNYTVEEQKSVLSIKEVRKCMIFKKKLDASTEDWVVKHLYGEGLSDFEKAVYESIGISSKRSFTELYKKYTQLGEILMRAQKGDADAVSNVARYKASGAVNEHVQKMLDESLNYMSRKEYALAMAINFTTYSEEAKNAIEKALKSKEITLEDILQYLTSDRITAVVHKLYTWDVEGSLNKYLGFDDLNLLVSELTSTTSIAFTVMCNIMDNIKLPDIERHRFYPLKRIVSKVKAGENIVDIWNGSKAYMSSSMGI